MFNYITGTLTEKTPTTATIETHGIGYYILTPLSTHQKLPERGAHAKLLIHFVVREDAQILYGFATAEERELFRLLISVSNVGPKMAMAVLSGIGIRELRQAIVDGAVPALSAISGIGRKTAERIIVELREKIILDEQDHTIRKLNMEERLLEDSLQALVSLGYKKQDAKTAIQKVLTAHGQKEKMNVEELIKESLKYV